MGEETKKVTEVTAENVEEVIKSGAAVTEELAKEAAEKIAKERKEQVTERLIECMKRSEYTRKKIALSMQLTNKIAKVKVNYTKAFTEKDEALRTGKLSIDEYWAAVKEAKETATKAIHEVERNFNKLESQLDEQYPEFRWGYNGYTI